MKKFAFIIISFLSSLHLNAQVYEGKFSTEYFEGKAKYDYNEAPDGSRIYNGQFSFEGDTKYIDDY